jgi:hypothetical protein
MFEDVMARGREMAGSSGDVVRNCALNRALSDATCAGCDPLSRKSQFNHWHGIPGKALAFVAQARVGRKKVRGGRLQARQSATLPEVRERLARDAVLCSPIDTPVGYDRCKRPFNDTTIDAKIGKT